MTVADSIKAQLDEAKYVMRRQMVRIAELEAEVERPKAGSDAHSVLQSIYADSNQPTGHRIKAAQAALPHEVPRLTPQPPAIDSTCEVIEPLAVVVERQRKRCDAMQGRNIEVLPSGQVLLLDERNGGNGQDD
jgi:hypothetical protein